MNRVDADHATVLSRAGKNFGWLAGSTGFSAVASLFYVALAARTLAPPGFGSFALVMTYGELVANLAQFQSWKALTSFGAAPQRINNQARLRRLFGYTTFLDFISGLAGALLGSLGVLLVGPWLHWMPAEKIAAVWFTTALLLTSSTTPAGILRLSNRFDLQVYSETVAQITRLAGCVAGWVMGARLGWFLGVWALAALLQLIVQWAAVLALGHRFSFGRRALRLTTHENSGLWSFMLKTNVSSTLSLFWMQCGTLVVGMRAGPIDAGGFRLAHRFSLAMLKPVEIAAKAVFPELAHLVAGREGRSVRKVLIRVSSISAVFGALVVIAIGFWGRDILHLVAGYRFEFAQEYLFLLSIAAAISVAGFALEPFLNAHFRAGTVLRAYAVAAFLYGALLIALLPSEGARAAATASIAAALAVIIQMGFSTARILSRGNHPSGKDRQAFYRSPGATSATNPLSS